MKVSLIQEKSFLFALHAIEFYKELLRKKEYILSSPFFRNVTSVGANFEEAQAVISKWDFISKMNIASKEAKEAH